MKTFDTTSFEGRISLFCEFEGIPEVKLSAYPINSEIVVGECGEIFTKEQLRYDFEENPDGMEDYASFEEFWEEATAMGGYFWRTIPCYFVVKLDGITMEDENCATARFDDIEEALEEAVYRAERNAKYDWISGEWKQPKIEIECYFCG